MHGFREALQLPNGKQESIEKGMEACRFWKEKTGLFEQNRIENKENRDHLFTNFLKDFESYAFPHDLKAFQKSLLVFLATQIRMETGIKPKTLTELFDILIKLKLYGEAKSIAAKLVKEEKATWPFYFLAQAQWLDREKDEARKNYLWAMLSFPDEAFLKRIKSIRLKKLSLDHGMELAPAYALAHGYFLPHIKTNDINPRNEKHAFGLKSYGLLVEAEKALKRGKNYMEERKRLKGFNGELYGVYFERLSGKKLKI